MAQLSPSLFMLFVVHIDVVGCVVVIVVVLNVNVLVPLVVAEQVTFNCG